MPGYSASPPCHPLTRRRTPRRCRVNTLQEAPQLPCWQIAGGQRYSKAPDLPVTSSRSPPSSSCINPDHPPQQSRRPQEPLRPSNPLAPSMLKPKPCPSSARPCAEDAPSQRKRNNYNGFNNSQLGNGSSEGRNMVLTVLFVPRLIDSRTRSPLSTPLSDQCHGGPATSRQPGLPRTSAPDSFSRGQKPCR